MACDSSTESVLVHLDVESLGPDVHKEHKPDFSTTKKLYSYIKKRVSISIIEFLMDLKVIMGITRVIMTHIDLLHFLSCVDICNICGIQESHSIL